MTGATSGGIAADASGVEAHDFVFVFVETSCSQVIRQCSQRHFAEGP